MNMCKYDKIGWLSSVLMFYVVQGLRGAYFNIYRKALQFLKINSIKLTGFTASVGT